MNQPTKFLFLIYFASISCNSEKASIEKWKAEIIETEKNFSEMASKEGIPKAFLNFAAADAVLERNNDLIIGKESIRNFFDIKMPDNEDINLTWEPDYVDVSSSGDLGYTYGQYVYSFIDSTGTKNESKGIFHTVWKRQQDGNWKFVWD